jgi:hypothetical protein
MVNPENQYTNWNLYKTGGIGCIPEMIHPKKEDANANLLHIKLLPRWLTTKTYIQSWFTHDCC